MSPRIIPGLSNRFTYASVGLLVAGTTATALAASTSAHAATESAGRTVNGTHTGNPVDVHASTVKALHAVARKATLAKTGNVFSHREHVSREHRVRPGETLAEIARTRLGDADLYREIFNLNRGKPQPGGDRLTDPDLIQPGWILELPAGAPAMPISHHLGNDLVDGVKHTDPTSNHTWLQIPAAVLTPIAAPYVGGDPCPEWLPGSDPCGQQPPFQKPVPVHDEQGTPVYLTTPGASNHASPARAGHPGTPSSTARTTIRSWAAPITASYSISEAYGVANSRYAAGHHTGVDLAVPVGTPIHAISNGTVAFAGWGGAYGNLIKIRGNDGRYSLYAHLSQIEVSVGDHVDAAHRIALSGASGNVTGPHLHFEVDTTLQYGSDINPVDYLAAHGIHL